MNAYQPIRASAPTNLAEALDALQPFLPTDRGMSISSYQPDCSLSGMLYIHVSTGSFGGEEVRGSASVGRKSTDNRLSDALFAAEAEHAALWQAKYGAVKAAEAEFAAYCPRLAA